MIKARGFFQILMHIFQTVCHHIANNRSYKCALVIQSIGHSFIHSFIHSLIHSSFHFTSSPEVSVTPKPRIIIIRDDTSTMLPV